MIRASTIAQLPVPLVVTDLDDHIVCLSRGIEQTFSIEIDAWPGAPLRAFLHALEHGAHGEAPVAEPFLCRDLLGRPLAKVWSLPTPVQQWDLPLTWVDVFPGGLAKLRAGSTSLPLYGDHFLQTISEHLGVAASELLATEEVTTSAHAHFWQTDDSGVWQIRRPDGASSFLIGPGGSKIVQSPPLVQPPSPSPVAAGYDTTVAQLVHDIRNPLTAARGLLQHLSGELSAEQAGIIAVAGQELERVGNLLTHLLHASRGQPGQPTPTNLSGIVESFTARMKSELSGSNITLDVELPEQDVTILGDPINLERVLQNLVCNARDALSAGGHIKVSLSLSMDRIVVLRVQDDGPGVPKEDLPHIFEPHFTTKRAGMGLGLTICREIIEAHGGRIAVTSEPGAGTTFTVFLTTAPAAGDRSTSTITAPAAPDETT